MFKSGTLSVVEGTSADNRSPPYAKPKRFYYYYYFYYCYYYYYYYYYYY